MLGLGASHQLRENRLLSNRVEPPVARHRGIAKEPAANDALEEVEGGPRFVQVCEVSRQVEETLRIAEVGADDAFDGGDALGGTSLDQRTGRDREVPEPRGELGFEVLQ